MWGRVGISSAFKPTWFRGTARPEALVGTCASNCFFFLTLATNSRRLHGQSSPIITLFLKLVHGLAKPNGVDEKGNKRRTQAEDQPPRDRLSQHLNRYGCDLPTNQTGVVEADEQVDSV